MNKKKNITYLIIGFIGVMLSGFGINMFNAYVLMSIPLIGRMIAMNRKLVGHYNYYGVSFNSIRLQTFLHFSQKYLFKALNRRSHKRSYTSEQFTEFLRYCSLARPHVKVKLY